MTYKDARTITIREPTKERLAKIADATADFHGWDEFLNWVSDKLADELNEKNKDRAEEMAKEQQEAQSKEEQGEAGVDLYA